MKCVLRKVNKGIIATIDEPCCEGEWGYNIISHKLSPPKDLGGYYFDLNKIIASNFGVGMELYMLLSKEMDLLLPIEDCLHFNKEYSYSIVDGKVVVEL